MGLLALTPRVAARQTLRSSMAHAGGSNGFSAETETTLRIDSGEPAEAVRLDLIRRDNERRAEAAASRPT